jgi:adenylate cyclase
MGGAIRPRFNGYFFDPDEITHAIVEQLKVKLLPKEKKSIGQARTDNVEAYTYYLRGRQFLHRHSKSYYELAHRMFTKAIELDPRYASAYAGMADCDSFMLLHYHADVPLQRIFENTGRALALNDHLAGSARVPRFSAFNRETIRGIDGRI